MKTLFGQFSTEERYFTLKNQLSSQADYKGRYDPQSNFNLPLSSPIFLAYYDDKGDFYEIDNVTLEYIIEEYIDGICNCYASNIEKFNQRLGMLPQNISHFSNQYLNRLSFFLENLSEISFIEDSIMNYLKDSIYKLQDFFKRYVENPYPSIKRKLNFNLKRNEVTYLFFILRQNNIISKDISDSQLAGILQNMIKYKSTSDEFKDIVGIKSLISDYNNPHGEKSKTLPAETLQNLFMRDDFYLK